MYHAIKKLVLPVMAATLIYLPSANAQKTPPPAPSAPTVPAAKPPRIQDFDDVRKELERAEAQLEQSLKNLSIPAPPAVDLKEIDKAMKEVDMQKIKAEMQKSLSALDREIASKEIDEALAKVDMAAIKKEMEHAKKEMESAMKKMEVDMVEQKEVMAKMKKDLKTLGPKIEAEMKTAREEMAKAKREMTLFENFVNSLASDGLLDKKAYTITHKNGKLIIDGKEQPDKVYRKHQTFLEKHKGLTITKNEDGLNINKD